MADYGALSALFPLSNPPPNPLKDATLIPSHNLPTEHELSQNQSNLPLWFQYINTVVEEVNRAHLDERGTADPSVEKVVGVKLATPNARLGFCRLVDVHERALANHPTSYKLWKSYIDIRDLYILGPPSDEEKLHLGRIKRRAKEGQEERQMLDYITKFLEDGTVDEADRDIDGGFTSGLDGSIGLKEWKSLAAVHERFITWHPKMPRAWLSYLNIFFHPRCPPFLSHTHARRTFDRAIRTLPPSLHDRIWRLYLRWAKRIGGPTLRHVYRRYIKVDPLLTETYLSMIAPESLASEPNPAALEAAKISIGLARKAANNEYKSPEGRSPLDLLIMFLEIAERWPDEVGMDVEESQKNNGETSANKSKAPVFDSTDPDVDFTNDAKLNLEKIITRDGLDVYTDQAGRLWTGLATFWIKKGEFERARDTFERGIASVLTIKDFTQIFDAYTEFSEGFVSSLMDDLTEAQENKEDENTIAEIEAELDDNMKKFEELMDRRPFLVNDVLLRRNPNDVQEWEKRIALCGTDDEHVSKTYQNAIKTINPRKVIGGLHMLYISYAKFFEEGGVAENPEDRADKDLESAIKVFEKAILVPFKRVDDLAEVWCEWAEMHVRNDKFDEAIQVMQRATILPRNTKISFHDDTLTAQERLFKSLKLWSFYLDLEESIGSIESTKKIYNQVFDLKIANAQIVINFANFLEENDYFEESFKVYERGLELFTFPIVFEIYNAYLSKFVKRYGGERLERARDLFEQALEKCPPKFAKPIFLLYGKLEEEYGLAKRALSVYERATKAVEPSDKFEMFEILIAKAVSNFGLSAARPIYQTAIESLPDRQTAEMCLRFSALERKLGEIDRARSILAHASQFCDPRTANEFWKTWNDFELTNGSEDTFKEMLRIRRAVQAAFNTETSYIVSKATAASAV